MCLPIDVLHMNRALHGGMKTDSPSSKSQSLESSKKNLKKPWTWQGPVVCTGCPAEERYDGTQSTEDEANHLQQLCKNNICQGQKRVVL